MILTFSDMIFCEDDVSKIESGDRELIELYKKLNKIFPVKYNMISTEKYQIKIPEEFK